MQTPRKTASTDMVKRALRKLRAPFAAVLVLSLFINLLLFVSPLYMLQIYDRVIASRSEATLWAISLIAVFLLLVYGALEAIRARVLLSAGAIFAGLVGPEVFKAVQRANVQRPNSASAALLRDVEVVRDFIGGAGFVTLADLPWYPVFVFAAFILHPWFGFTAIFGGAAILGLSLANARFTGKLNEEANERGRAAMTSAHAALENTSALQAMGMTLPLLSRWGREQRQAIGAFVTSAARGNFFHAATKAFRLILQAFILGEGAYLVIHQQLSGGAIIAASVLIGRALQPVEQAVGQWKALVNARMAWRRIAFLLDATHVAPVTLNLPRPTGALDVEGVAVGDPATRRLVVRNATFRVAPGKVAAIVGPSGSGKSTLLRAIVGAAPLAGGAIRLGGHDIRHWQEHALGQHLGYLPQEVELLRGTIAENISRFADGDHSAEVLEAAGLAACEQMIQSLPDGYDTQVGPGGHALSGGQRQRVGLARALFGSPVLVALDEPDASLDADGCEALRRALVALKERGVTVIMVTHRSALLDLADCVIAMEAGVAALRPASAPPKRPAGLRPAFAQPPVSRPFGGVALASRLEQGGDRSQRISRTLEQPAASQGVK
ncbi:type I secretion system permease/ATPase [Camelimonas abortus]|uniref:Type I secretion system permease/ATPase n=1 Tax=Camelimonas abortus TaxID=1017184 RepID=A0ABV7LGW0_9HYPH